MSITTILIIAGILLLILIVIGVIAATSGSQRIRRLENRVDDKKDSARPRLAGDSSTDAPLPDGDVKKKKRKGK